MKSEHVLIETGLRDCPIQAIKNLEQTFAENRPIEVFENRPSDHLVHSYGRGKWIPDRELQELALKIYEINGRGITSSDVINKFECSKPKAQPRLKNACIEKIDKNGKKSSILFRLDNERTKPQQYYPSCIKARIIENKRNRPIDPTGVSYNNKASYYPLHNAIEKQTTSYFLEQLLVLPFQPLNMHNIRLWTIIDKSHYEEIEPKIQEQWIGLRKVVYQFYKKGSIDIEIACSKNPFPIETDNDVNNFFVFLGQVKDRLANILHDPRERIVPPVDNWILKCCDLNKDVELDDKNNAQCMGLNMQIKSVGEAFRLYVKNLEDRFALRGEKVMKVNQPITSFMNESILNPLHFIQNTANECANNIAERIITDIDKRIDNKLEKLLSKDKNFANSK